MELNDLNKTLSKLDTNVEQLLKNSDALLPFFKSIIEILIEFQQNYQEMHLTICNLYVKKLHKITGNNISALRSITGLTEGVIKKALNNKIEYSIEKDKDLFSAAFSEINSYCYHKKVNRMPTTEFYKAMLTYNGDGHISVKSRIQRLIDTGLIDKNINGVSIIFDKAIKKRTENDTLRILAKKLSICVSSIIYNNNKNDLLPPLFQRLLRSTQIHPDNTIEIVNKANQFLAKCLEEGNSLLTEYEEDVPSGTYPEIILSFLLYNQHLTEKQK